MMFRLTTLVSVALLVACSKEPPVDLAQVALPKGDLMRRCEPLPAIPACEHDKRCRTEHYAAEDETHGRCAAKVDGLQRYITASRGTK